MATRVGHPRRILILAPFFSPDANKGGSWIDDFSERPDLQFKKAPYPTAPKSWHKRGAVTPLGEWLNHIRYVRQALQWRTDCVVTSFPQLALVASVLLSLQGSRKTRLIAWNFNLGSLNNAWKGRLVGRLLGRADRFIVHARGEIEPYAAWLGISTDRFRFVPLQQGLVRQLPASPIPAPYLVSLGSAQRDFPTLIEAVLGTGIKTVVISKRSFLDQLPEHPDLIKLSGLSMTECNSILAGATINVTPIRPTHTAAGQITFINAMQLGVPTVATRCVGTVDYIHDGETGLLTPPGDALAMRVAIESLWSDAPLRERIGAAAKAHVLQHCSDEAAGRHLSRIIAEVS